MLNLQERLSESGVIHPQLSERGKRIAEACAVGATMATLTRELDVTQEEYDNLATLPVFESYVFALQHPITQTDCAEVRDQLDALGPKAVAVLNDNMADKDKRVRNSAAKEVLDRVYPKVIKNENTENTKVIVEAKVLVLAIESAITASGIDPKLLAGKSEAEVVELLTPGEGL